jgi:hypothetical protein
MAPWPSPLRLQVQCTPTCFRVYAGFATVFPPHGVLLALPVPLYATPGRPQPMPPPILGFSCGLWLQAAA